MSKNKWMSQLADDLDAIIASDMKSMKEDVITMPSPSLNWAVGNGGIVTGKIATLYGPESSGKSLLGQLILAEIQKRDPQAICILFDAEYAYNKEWFKKLGGDPDRLLVKQTNDPVKIFDFIWGKLYENLQDGAPIRGMMIDSVRSIVYPRDVKDVSTKLIQGGSGAAYLTSALKRVIPVVREHLVTTILIQQIYEELDQYKKLANPYVVPDGKALKHASDYMLQVEKFESKKHVLSAGETIDGNQQQVGHTVRVKVKKNRTAAPARVAQFTLDYTKGIVDTTNELVDLAKSLRVIYHPINPATGKENAQMWKFAAHESIRGEDAMRKWFMDNSTIVSELLAACNAAKDEEIVGRNTELNITDMDVDISIDDEI